MKNPFEPRKVKTVENTPLPTSLPALPDAAPAAHQPVPEPVVVEPVVVESVEESPAGSMDNYTEYGVVDEYGNRIPCATLAEAKILSLLLEAKGNI